MSADAAGPRIPALLVIVQARLSSSRLPGKVLLEAGGTTLLGHLLRRLSRSAYRPKIVVATTTAAADERVAAEALRFGAAVFRGPEADVLGRFAGALAEHPAEVVVRITADNPLLDPAEMDRVIGEFLSRWDGPEPLDYATNHGAAGSALGLDVEVFSAAVLERAAREAEDPGDREHVTAYLYRVPGRFRVLRTPYPDPALFDVRLTVDTHEDFELVRNVLERLGPNSGAAEIARFVAANPELARLNSRVVQRTIESEADLRRRRIAGRVLAGRADASSAIGFGHAARVGALLEAWTELGGRALLIGRGTRGSLESRLCASSIELVEPPADDAAITAAIASKAAAAAIAIDGYHFDAAHHRRLCAAFPLLAIDDLAVEPAVADVVVNPNLDFDRSRYGSPRSGQRLLVGAPYVLLRRGLRRLAATPGEWPPERPGRIALCFGGSDPLALTEAVLDELVASTPEADLDVLVGPGIGADRARALAAKAAAAPGVTLHVDAAEVGEILARAAVLITAAGSTVWEALSLGIPPILVTVADNQRVVAEAAVTRGVALDAGRAGTGTARRAAELALGLLHDAELRAKLSRTGRALIDGRGVWRAIDALLDAIDERTNA